MGSDGEVPDKGQSVCRSHGTETTNTCRLPQQEPKEGDHQARMLDVLLYFSYSVVRRVLLNTGD